MMRSGASVYGIPFFHADCICSKHVSTDSELIAQCTNIDAQALSIAGDILEGPTNALIQRSCVCFCAHF
ncbi:hypothetical protein PILCRDRAFT_152658 [Piloderma croceum F 1598]|uniref:Uncharacterized protein n=1 Tax=Piloderma croceum (strain F 1598) TaxID=765440 RepID=A0A0C3BWE6_PILCF|nr:hypothetical protein PILCRDRAFT_152658 [Piloderma croceum F 1598]